MSNIYHQQPADHDLGIIFDVDGVLFDSRRSNMAYYNLVRRAVHLPPLTPEEEDYCHMASTNEALDKIIPSKLRNMARSAARTINYRELILPMLEPEKGLLEALHWLKECKVPMGICTNRTNSVNDLLCYFGLEDFFNPIKTAQNCRPKPDPQGLLETVGEWNLPKEKVVFIGDSKVDELAAGAAQVSFWAFKNETLEAKLHITSYFDLINWLSPLLEGP